MKNDYLGTATYSPEDNKLRFYADARLDSEDYARIKKQGFRWAPKQELFVKPSWSPQAEDLMLEWCGSVEDEDKSPEDRSADRAERFAMYRDKRRGEAGGYADNYENSSPVHGFQSQKKAEVSARRHDRQRVNAYTQWDKAEYWQTRTKSVIGHALYKAKTSLRRARVLKLEAEQRKHNKQIAEAQATYKSFKLVEAEQDKDKAFKMVYAVVNSGGFWGGYDNQHPRKDQTSSLFGLLTDQEDPITAAEACAIFLKGRVEPNSEGSYSKRWQNHLVLRLAYEKQMIEAEGGNVSEVEMVAGGFIGKHQIIRVNKSPITKLATSVVLMAPKQWYRGEGEAPLVEASFNIQRLGADSYRSPTEEELVAFKASQAERKTLKQAENATKPKLINPDKESAEILQAIWNAKAKEGHDRMSWKSSEYNPTKVREMTQAQYSSRAKGSYSNYETVSIQTDGHRTSQAWNAPKVPVSCKVRKCYNSTNFTHQADSVVLITDKPQKKLPQFKAVEKVVKEEVTV